MEILILYDIIAEIIAIENAMYNLLWSKKKKQWKTIYREGGLHEKTKINH